MATVTSNLTRLHDLEGSLTSVAIGGGAGAAANTDIFIQNAQSLGRRLSNVTLSGFLIDDGAGNDLSAASMHLGVWIWVTHYAAVTALRIRCASNSGSANYDEHIVPLTQYPKLGGWIRVWLDISRTPDATGGTALDEASVRYVGPVLSLPTVGGNAANVILDAIDYGTKGLTLTGTSGVWQDFLTADEGTQNNKYGVVYSLASVIYCLSRLTLGTASSLVFNDSNFVIIFPEQTLVESTYMGITIDLQNASTNIDWSGAVINSPGTVKGDIVVTGTSGTFDVINSTLNALRIITLTSTCTFTKVTFQLCGLITQSSSVISTCAITNASGAVAILSNDPSKISNCTFTSDGTGHAIEINTAGTYTFTGNTFSGYAASNGTTGNEAIYNNSGGSVVLNIAGGGGTPSIRNGASASTTVNNNIAVTLTGMKDNTEIRVYTTATTTELAGTENATTGTADNRSFTFSLSAGTVVDIVIHSISYESMRIDSYTVPNADTSLPISQRTDRNYSNV